MIMLLFICWFVLTLWASAATWSDDLMTPGDKLVDMLLIWLLPILGAVLVLFLRWLRRRNSILADVVDTAIDVIDFD